MEGRHSTIPAHRYEGAQCEDPAMRRAAAEQNEILVKQASEQATIQREAARAQKESRHLAAGVAGGVGGGMLGMSRAARRSKGSKKPSA